MSAARRDRLLLVAFFGSGLSALGYELLWTRLLSTVLGNETLGVLGVLAGFFGGLALGAFALHRRAITSKNPARLFAILEVVAASYAMLFPFALYSLAGPFSAALGPSAGTLETPAALAGTIAIAGATLLPGTFCMGATLPALVEARRRVITDEPDGRGVGRLYAANTAGATLGVLLTVYAVLPALGVGWSSVLLGTIGFGAAAIALRWGKANAAALAESRPAEDAEPVDASKDPDPEVANEPWLLLLVLGATGLFGVGLEVVGVQVLSQILENTIYTFADILAVYLIGTAAGAAIYARVVRKALAGRPASVAAGLLIAVAAMTVLASGALAWSPAILEAIAPAEGSSRGAHLISEFAIAAIVFGPPTLVMGATFSHLTGLIAPLGTGRAYAANTLGGALAPILFTLWVIPSNGYRDAIFVVVYGYLITFGVFTWFRRFKAKWQVGLILGVVITTVAAPADLVLVKPDAEWETLEQHETVMGLVLVSEHKTGDKDKPLRRLQVGKHFRMGGAFAFGERRMGHVPLLLHGEPSSALYLGVGTGATLGAVTAYPSLLRVDAVELVPKVIDQLSYFDEINSKVYEDDRVTIHAADARRFVAAGEDKYDVIVADLFHPGRDGAGGLYAKEHFEAVARRLAPGGLFTQWVPLYQLDLPTLETIVRTFLAAFDDAHAMLGVYNVQTPGLALVGRTSAWGGLDPAALATVVAQPLYKEVLMAEPRDLLGSYLLDRDGLAALAGDGPLNTDLRPRVMLDAPRAAYEGNTGQGWTNLQAIYEHAAPIAAELLRAEDPQAWHADAARFHAALHRYLQGEHGRVAVGATKTVPAESVDHFLAAYEVAPDFPPARGMLYTAAAASPDAARKIYPRMLERTPKEPRVYQAYLAFLHRTGDKARFEEVKQMARTNLEAPQGD